MSVPEPTVSSEPILVARELRVTWPGADVPAVDGVGLELRAGESVGLVGRSGCGKSTLLRALFGLVPCRGTVEWYGRDLGDWCRVDEIGLRSRAQLLLQNPLLAFDPRQRIGAAIGDALRRHGRSAEGVDTLLARVGLPAGRSRRYPHALSGGELQRAALARALAVEPEVLVLDEALVSLDPGSRAAIADLLLELQQNSTLTYLYVGHDLGLVAGLARRMVVMEAGKIVDAGETSDVLSGSREPATRRLIDASPMWKGAEIGGRADV